MHSETIPYIEKNNLGFCGKEIELIVSFKMKKKRSAPKFVTSRQENNLKSEELQQVEKRYILSTKSQFFFTTESMVLCTCHIHSMFSKISKVLPKIFLTLPWSLLHIQNLVTFSTKSDFFFFLQEVAVSNFSMKVTLAVLAGCLSSLGSVFSKLASLFQSEDEQMASHLTSSF